MWDLVPQPETDWEPLHWGGFPSGSAGKESACNAGDLGLISELGRSPGEGNSWLPTPVFWPGEFHGLHSPRSHKESDTNEGLLLSLSILATEQKGQEDTEPAVELKNTSSLEPVEKEK